jgi:holo-[acyl-carrier protein] synthase
MDIIGLGTEIVECARVRAMIEEHGERFLTRVYTPEEIRRTQSRKNTTELYAALWAAKEAVFKCLHVPGRSGSPWSQVEIEFQDQTPQAKIGGKLRQQMTETGIGSVLVTIAFTRNYATATAISLRVSDAIPF